MSNTDDTKPEDGLFALIYLYVNTLTSVFNAILNPILKIIGKFSPTLQNSIEKTLPPIYKFILTLPVFIPILSVSAYVFNDMPSMPVIESEINNIGLTTIQTQIGVLVMCLGVLTSFVFYYFYEKSAYDSFVMPFFIVLSGIPLMYLDTPNVYIYIMTILFAIGAYSTTYIPYNNYTSMNKILEEHDVDKTTLGYICMYLIAISPIIFAINNQYFNENIIVFLTIILALISYLITYLQKELYKKIYENQKPNLSSRTLLYPARISVVYASGVTILTQSVSVFNIGLYLVPVVTLFIFYKYVTSEDEYGISHTIEDEHRLNSMRDDIKYGEKPSINELECDVSRPEDENMSINLNLNIEIPEDKSLPEEAVETFVKTTTDVHNIIMQLDNPDSNIDKEKYNKLYDDASEFAYSHLQNEDSGLKPRDWPRKLLVRIQDNLYKNEDTTMDDIVEFEKYIDSKNVNVSDIDSYINT